MLCHGAGGRAVGCRVQGVVRHAVRHAAWAPLHHRGAREQVPDEIQLVVFAIGALRLALMLRHVDRVLSAAAVTPVPGAPAGVLGVCNVAGTLLPVLDLRAGLGQAPAALAASDQFLLVDTGRRNLALLVQRTDGVVVRPAAALHGLEAVAPGAALPRYAGAFDCGGEFVLIHDPERFFSDGESRQLDRALAAGGPP